MQGVRDQGRDYALVYDNVTLNMTYTHVIQICLDSTIQISRNMCNGVLHNTQWWYEISSTAVLHHTQYYQVHVRLCTIRSCCVRSCTVRSCQIVSCQIVYYQVVLCQILYCQILSDRVMSDCVLSGRVVYWIRGLIPSPRVRSYPVKMGLLAHICSRSTTDNCKPVREIWLRTLTRPKSTTVKRV